MVTDVRVKQGSANTGHVDLTPPSNNSAGKITFTNGGWSTSFDYSEACFGGGIGGTNCTTVADDGVDWSRAGNYTDPGWYPGMATADANNPNGSGGLGYRGWYEDGVNQGSGGPVMITFPSRQPQLWIRWYHRIESGFVWSGGGEPSYDKWLYMRFEDSRGSSSSGEVIVGETNGVKAFIQVSGVDGHQIQSGRIQEELSWTDHKWTDLFGNPSDGLWHMIEVYIKIDTDSTDGEFRLWADGVLETEKLGLDYSGGNADIRSGLGWFDFYNNQSSPANGGYKYVDIDDMCIYNTDPGNRDEYGNPWIGPINGFSGGS